MDALDHLALCCVNCFVDDYLKNYIRENGHPGKCDFCGKSRLYCIEPEQLADLFIPIIHLYSTIENFMPIEELKEFEGAFIWEKLSDDWHLFNTENLDYEKVGELLCCMFPSDPREDPPQFLSSYVERESKYWGDDDEISEKLAKRWDEFCHEIKHENRYFIKKQVDLDTISDLLHYLSVSMIDDTLYRARNNPKKRDYHLPPAKMGKPTAKKSQHGRANPKGIPYLYLASDPETAVAEIRPTIHDKVTVGKFSILEALDLIDLRNPRIESPFNYKDDLEFIVQHLAFLKKLGNEISKPVNSEDPELDYLPLQYLCEFIKHKGYDGVIYNSSLSAGYNLAIFNENKLQCKSAKLYSIDLSLKTLR